jgi:hypothetical protein
MKTAHKKGQHVVCRYGLSDGKSNGDLVVGRIESVRTNGDVILTRLPEGTRAVKGADVLSSRNVVVTKREAEEVLAVIATRGPNAGRAAAVYVARRALERSPGQLALKPNTGRAAAPVPTPEEKVKAAVATLDALSDDELAETMRTEGRRILSIFGVAE